MEFDDDFGDFGTAKSDEDDFDSPRTTTAKKTATKEKLSALFDAQPAPNPATSPAVPVPSTSTSSVQSKAVFSCVVSLYVQNAQFEPVGRVGLAVIARRDTATILLYAGNKQQITQLNLQSHTEFQCRDAYISFTDAAGRGWSMHFDEESQLTTILAWMILKRGELEKRYVLKSGADSERTVADGDSVLITVAHYSINEDATLEEVIEGEVKLRASSNAKKQTKGYEKHLIGLRKTATVMLFDGERACRITVKKVKGRGEPVGDKEKASEPLEISTESQSQPLSEEVIEANKEINTVLQTLQLDDPVIASDEKNSVLERIARVGRPLLPTVLPAKTAALKPDEEPEEIPTLPAPTTLAPVPPIPTARTTVTQPLVDTQPSTVAQPSYADFHKAIGVEIDRLQVRLENSFARMLEQAIAPLREEMREVRDNQRDLLLLLRKRKSEEEDVPYL